MKKTIFITYFVFVTLLFVTFTFSFVFDKQLYYSWYRQYLPEEIMYPCDDHTGEVVFKGDIIEWSYSDYNVPWYGITSYEIYCFIKNNGTSLYIFVFLLYLPILLYYKKNIAIVYWIVLAFEVVMIIYFFYGMNSPPCRC